MSESLNRGRETEVVSRHTIQGMVVGGRRNGESDVAMWEKAWESRHGTCDHDAPIQCREQTLSDDFASTVSAEIWAQVSPVKSRRGRSPSWMLSNPCLIEMCSTLRDSKVDGDVDARNVREGCSVGWGEYEDDAEIQEDAMMHHETPHLRHGNTGIMAH